MPAVPDRLAAWGQQLIETHDRLRDELDRLLDGLDETSALTPALRTHCVAFCDAISRHHTGEDRTAFPALAAQYPDLRDTLDGLAAILESHFRWEERAVVAALDGLTDPDLSAERLFGRDV